MDFFIGREKQALEKRRRNLQRGYLPPTKDDVHATTTTTTTTATAATTTAMTTTTTAIKKIATTSPPDVDDQTESSSELGRSLEFPPRLPLSLQCRTVNFTSLEELEAAR